MSAGEACRERGHVCWPLMGTGRGISRLSSETSDERPVPLPLHWGASRGPNEGSDIKGTLLRWSVVVEVFELDWYNWPLGTDVSLE